MQIRKNSLCRHTQRTIDKIDTTRQKHRGITFIELLIAIFVFTVGILSIMHMLTQNISLVDRTKLNATATLLAKEAMELTFHHRNTNVLLSYDRQCAYRDQDLSSVT